MTGPAEGPTPADRFQLVRQLHSDAPGALWLARDTTLDEVVLLRLGREDLPWDGTLREALKRACALGRRLHHRGILRVLDFHPDDKAPCISMEPADGAALDEWQGRPLAEWLPVLVQVSEAVADAHSQGAVHRRLSPSRIRFDARGRPRVWGFGTEALLEAAAGVPADRFVSPQQAGGDPPAPADDVFALGELAAWLAGGEPGAAIPEVDPSGQPVPPALAALIDRMRAPGLGERLTDLGAAAAELATYAPGAVLDSGSADRVTGERLMPLARGGEGFRRGAATGTAAPAAAVTPETSGKGLRLAVGAGVVVLLVALVGVVFFLPRLVEQPSPEETVTAPEETEPSEDPQAEIRRLLEDKRAAEAVLAKIEPIRAGLAGRSVERWGGGEWRAGEEALANGQAAFERREYETARSAFETALAAFEGIETGLPALLAGQMSSGAEALARGDGPAAQEAYELALAMDPTNAEADAGLARARALPAVMEAMDEGAAAEAGGDFDAAEAAYARAAELDPAFEAASEARDRVRGARADQGFRSLMSQGYAALEREAYDTARARFERAARMRPNSDEPRDGLAQAAAGARRLRIEAHRADAEAAEQAEAWPAAVTAYQAILEEDAALAFAQEGLAQARFRAALDSRITAYLEDPLRLAADSVLQAARKDLAVARAVQPPPPRLAEQVQRLDEQVRLAVQPVPVAILSDNATEVTVYRVGRLGSFERRDLNLKPGRYTAVGTRVGYRDVRHEFTIMPGQAVGPVVVRCEEPI